MGCPLRIQKILLCAYGFCLPTLRIRMTALQEQQLRECRSPIFVNQNPVV
jgi:hypothetical protein